MMMQQPVRERGGNLSLKTPSFGDRDGPVPLSFSLRGAIIASLERDEELKIIPLPPSSLI